MLEHAYDVVDYVSCHAYYEELDGDLGSFLARAVDMDHFVRQRRGHRRQRRRPAAQQRKRINISFDEWNVWYLSRFQAAGAARPTGRWRRALIEDEYTVADAVVVGSLLISLLRHSDRVTAACQAQLVNVIAPIRTEPGGPAWRQTIFHPFATTAALARGDVLRAALRLADVRDGPATARCRWWTRSPPTTPRPATWWSSPSTATRRSRSS